MEVDASAGLYFTDGVVVRAGTMALGAGFNSAPDAACSRILFLLNGEWHDMDVETDAIVSISATRAEVFAVGVNGLTVMLPLAPGVSLEGLADAIEMRVIDEAMDFGELTRIRVIGSQPYCCGQCGQVYQFTHGVWRRIDAGLRSDDGPDFEDIDGSGPSHLHAVGIEGAVYRFDGYRWSSVDVPTNVNLSNVRYVSPDLVYVCGDHGTVLRGESGRWSFVGERVADRHYWGLAELDGTIYLSHSAGIDRIIGDSVEPVDLSQFASASFNRVHGRDGELWSIGEDDLLRFDKNGWARINVPVRT